MVYGAAGALLTGVTEAGRPPQLPSLGVHLQLLNSPSLRKFLLMSQEHSGVMVTHVEHNSSAEAGAGGGGLYQWSLVFSH